MFYQILHLASIAVHLTSASAESRTRCVAGVAIHHPVVEASVAAVNNLVIVRARTGADISKARKCLSGTPGMHWVVVDGGQPSIQLNDTSADPRLLPCLYGKLFRGFLPGGGQTSASEPNAELLPHTLTNCNPTSHQEIPWLCEAGNWSGKFGFLQVEIPAKESLRKGSTETITRGYGTPWGHDEVRVHTDGMAIPACALEGKYLGLYCGGVQSSLLACERFETLQSDSEAPNLQLEQALRFVIDFPQARPCPTPEQLCQGKDWSDKLRDEFKRLPGKMSGWWGDIKSTGEKALNGSTFWN